MIPAIVSTKDSWIGARAALTGSHHWPLSCSARKCTHLHAPSRAPHPSTAARTAAHARASGPGTSPGSDDTVRKAPRSPRARGSKSALRQTCTSPHVTRPAKASSASCSASCGSGAAASPRHRSAGTRRRGPAHRLHAGYQDWRGAPAKTEHHLERGENATGSHCIPMTEAQGDSALLCGGRARSLREAPVASLRRTART